eukprot:s2819_g9.t1
MFDAWKATTGLICAVPSFAVAAWQVLPWRGTAVTLDTKSLGEAAIGDLPGLGVVAMRRANVPPLVAGHGSAFGRGASAEAAIGDSPRLGVEGMGRANFLCQYYSCLE